jgi:protein-tyrosine phosphatase
MIPLVDMHCHLLAGVDDGPRTDEEVLEMCRIASSEGIGYSVALAHQNEQYPEVTPQLIRERVPLLSQALREAAIPLSVYPCAEVMADPDLEARWGRGELFSVADRGKYLLVEMPHGLFVDLRPASQRLRKAGVRILLAHAERQPEFLHDPGRIEQFIEAGCLVQVNSASVTNPSSGEDEKALRDWFRRGVVHVMGSDAHSPRRRRPQMREAYEQVVRWAGAGVADRVFSTHATAILHGLPLSVPTPEPRKAGWFARFW